MSYSYFSYGKPPNPPPADCYRSEFAPLRHVEGLLPPPDPAVPLTGAEYEKHQRYDWYQRAWLHGFTLQELRDAGCWYKADAKPNDLKTAVHPLYKKSRWDKKGTLDMDPEDEEKGKWEYKNEVVREAIMPSLRLASLILTNSAFWPFVDALLHGEWKIVPPESMKDGCPPENAMTTVCSFHSRDPVRIKADKDKQATAFKDLCGRLTLGIESAIANITKDPSRTLGSAFHHAHWKSDGTYTKSTLHVMTETIKPLLRDDHTVSERLAQQWSLARTICHETIHALGAYTLQTRNILKSAEPFFEDEAAAELGRAWENITFGGWLNNLHNIDRTNYDEPVLGDSIMTWPNFAVFGIGRYTPNKRRRYRYHDHPQFQKGATFDLWPIQMDFIENIQQDSWWRTQPTKYQANAFKTPRILGRRYKKQGASVKILGPDYYAWVGGAGQQGPEPPIPPNANDLQKWEIEQRRRVRANAIKTQLRRQQEYLDALTAKTNQIALGKAKKAKEQEHKELELLQKAADLYDASNQTPSFEAYLPLRLSNSLAVRAQAFVAISEMQHASQQKADELRDEGLALLKTYQEENPESEITMKVEAAIKKLMELGRLRRETVKEDWELV